MKKIIALLVVIMVFSCDKELDLKPTSSVDASAAKQHIDLLVTGAFGTIGSGGTQPGGLYSTDLLLDADLLASENYMTWTGTFSQYNEISNKIMSSQNSSVIRMWNKAYQAINLANVILENLNNADAADRDVFKGEALFIRGIVQFELLRLFKDPQKNLGIPLVTKSTESFEGLQLPSRASIADSYAAVLKDLTDAKALLPERYDVFGNKYSCAAFLARVYLDKGDYANALAQADDVIENGGYSLANSVEQAFNNSLSEESIFEIQQTTQNNAGTANDGLTTFYSCDPQTPGNTGRGDVSIDDAFVDRYEEGDKRRDLLIYEGTCNKGSVTSSKWKNPYTNIVVIRLSEMYLIRAEANVRLGSSVGDTPLNDVNKIRAKANASELTTVTLDDVLNERDLELAFEGQRIHDYRRTGKVITLEDEDGNPFDVDYTGPEFVLPIPQGQINTNKNIEQNSYYE